MPEQSFWTSESELEARAESKHAKTLTPGPLLDPAMQQWFDQSPKTFSLGRKMPGSAEEYRQWQGRLRAYLNVKLSWPPAIDCAEAMKAEMAGATRPEAPLDAQVVSRKEFADYIQEEVIFNGASPLRIPATVLIPRQGSGPFPAVIALHDMSGLRLYARQKLMSFEGEPDYLTQFRNRVYQGRSVMHDLVARGYLVIAIDSICFGERTVAAGRDFAAYDQQRRTATQDQANVLNPHIFGIEEPMLVRHLMSIGWNWAGLVYADDRRTVDYLCSRADVDVNRIGCAGLSFGAYRTNYLAGMDTRIKAAVSVCWTSTMDGVLGYNITGSVGWFVLLPEVLAHLDLPDIQALAAPRAFMTISGWRDELMQPFGITRAHQLLRKAYTVAGCPEKLGSLVFDAPHEFNSAMQDRAWEFLDVHLK